MQFPTIKIQSELVPSLAHQKDPGFHHFESPQVDPIPNMLIVPADQLITNHASEVFCLFRMSETGMQKL